MGVEKRKRFLINAAYIAVIALLVFVVLHYLLPMVAPFAIAAVVAWMLHRPIRFLEENTELPPKRCAIFMVVLFYGTIGVLIFVAGTHLFSGLATLVGSITTLYEAHGQPFFADILANVENILMRLDPSLVAALDSLGTDVLGSLRQMIYNLSVTAMGVITGFAYSIPGLFIKLVLMIISTLFIAIDYRRLTGFCLRQMDERTQNLFIQVKEYVVGTLLVCLRSYLIIMSITFVELAVCLSLLKIKYSVLVAAVIAVFDILPVLGTGGVMIPWTILTALQGNAPRALGLLATYIGITVIRNIIEPKIVGGQLGLHPVVTLCSMFLGLQLFGVFGLFGFPILLSLLCYLNDHGVIQIFR